MAAVADVLVTATDIAADVVVDVDVVAVVAVVAVYRASVVATAE